MRKRRFETAPENPSRRFAPQEGHLSARDVVFDLKGLFPLALRSRRLLAASRRAVTEKIDTPLHGGGDRKIRSRAGLRAKPAPSLSKDGRVGMTLGEM